MPFEGHFAFGNSQLNETTLVRDVRIGLLIIHFSSSSIQNTVSNQLAACIEKIRKTNAELIQVLQHGFCIGSTAYSFPQKYT